MSHSGKSVLTLLFVVEHSWEMLKLMWVRGWLDHVLVVDKSLLEMKVE